MANPFDQFDQQANPFDAFDIEQAPKPEKKDLLTKAKERLPVGNLFSAIGEPIMRMGSGLIAKPVSEIAGLAATAKDVLSGNIEGDPQGFKREIQQQLTYEPRTQVGASEYNPLNAIPSAIGSAITKGVNLVADPLQGESAADQPRGLAANLLREGVPQALGFLGMKKGPKAIQSLDDVLAKRETALAQKAVDRSVKDTAIKEAREAGFVTTPAVSDAGYKARALEGILGSPKLQHGAKFKNVETSKTLVKQDLGIDPHTPLSKGAVEDVISNQGKVYEELKQVGKFAPDNQFTRDLKILEAEVIARNRYKTTANAEFANILDDLKKPGFDAEDAVNLMKGLRADASANLLAVEKGAASKPQQMALGQYQKRAAQALENMVARNLADAEKAFPGYGYGELSSRFSNARQTIAKGKNILKSLDEHGNIDARKLGELRAKGAYMSGGTEKVAKFGAGFPEIASVPHGSMNVPITWTEGLIGGLGATMSPWALAYPVARGGGRSLMLSKAGQKMFGPQTFEPGMLSSALRGAAQTPEALQQLMLYSLAQQRERQE